MVCAVPQARHKVVPQALERPVAVLVLQAVLRPVALVLLPVALVLPVVSQGVECKKITPL